MCGLFLFSAFITAQAQFRAGIQGTVSDSNGALVPEAKVTLKDTETGRTQEATTSRRLLSHPWPRAGQVCVDSREDGLQEEGFGNRDC